MHKAERVDKMKWISVAREWLTEHTPCTKLEAIQGIATAMPLGIRRDGKIASRTELACEAIYRIYETKLADLPEVLEKPAAKTREKTGVTRRIMELANNGDGALYSEIKLLKNGQTIALQLVRNSILRRDGDRFFRHS